MIAQTLAGTGRHDAEHVASGEDVGDHLALHRAKAIEPEDALQLLLEVAFTRVQTHLGPGGGFRRRNGCRVGNGMELRVFHDL